jgi:putative transposase
MRNRIETGEAGQPANSVHRILMERCKQAALSFGVELLEQEVESLCGVKFSHKNEAQCHRGGSDWTTIVVGGAKQRLQRPRVRNSEGEVDLEMLAKLQSQDVLDREILSRMMKSVSTRNYEGVIESLSDKLSVSKSSASRAFVRASQKDLEAINSAPLEDLRFVAITVDGVEFARCSVVVALGITTEGEKIPLGLREGNTEDAVLVKDLLERVVERGFTIHGKRLLAVMDGAKALKKALKAVFGESVVLQRCWLHKLRNLKSYVPQSYHPMLLLRMRRMMTLNTHDDAKKEMASLMSWLAEISLEAANSLEEAGSELLTVHQLGVTGETRKSLASTNLIESLLSVVREKTNRVKNWKSAPGQITRWVASSILSHKSKMRRIRGYKHINVLVEGLNTLAQETKSA